MTTTLQPLRSFFWGQPNLDPDYIKKVKAEISAPLIRSAESFGFTAEMTTEHDQIKITHGPMVIPIFYKAEKKVADSETVLYNLPLPSLSYYFQPLITLDINTWNVLRINKISSSEHLRRILASRKVQYWFAHLTSLPILPNTPANYRAYGNGITTACTGDLDVTVGSITTAKNGRVYPTTTFQGDTPNGFFSRFYGCTFNQDYGFEWVKGVIPQHVDPDIYEYLTSALNTSNFSKGEYIQEVQDRLHSVMAKWEELDLDTVIKLHEDIH